MAAAPDTGAKPSINLFCVRLKETGSGDVAGINSGTIIKRQRRARE
jgi:hypothetical protein